MSTEPVHGWDVELIVETTLVAAVDVHPSLPSTNDLGLQLAIRDNISLPLLVLANEQTRGRGRGQNSWWSSAGALTFSLLAEFDAQTLPTSRWPEMSLTVGSSICAALRGLLPGEDVRLKWPNDVYVGGAKACGVLVEIPQQSTGRVVIGVGVNVANSVSSAPVELQETAVALCDVGGPTCRQTVLLAILQELESQLTLLVDDPETVRSCWRRDDLLIGRSVTLGDGIAEVSGTAVGIDDDGALLLRTEAGTRRCYGGVVQTFD